MPSQPIAISEDWAEAVRIRIGDLPPQPDTWDIEQLRDRLTSVAWLSGSPTAASVEPSNLPRRYRRHLIATGSNSSYTALLIAWPPGYRTPLHDHDGLWGIELVIDGALAIEEFGKGGEAREPALEHQRTLILGIGDATAFTSPGYVHSCRNLSAQRTALSLHVYGGVLDEYSTFHTTTLGHYTATRQRASIDTVLI
jgi:predicted metal-dependent enzyme (double-stranded beta helix superfamily)